MHPRLTDTVIFAFLSFFPHLSILGRPNKLAAMEDMEEATTVTVITHILHSNRAVRRADMLNHSKGTARPRSSSRQDTATTSHHTTLSPRLDTRHLNPPDTDRCPKPSQLATVPVPVLPEALLPTLTRCRALLPKNLLVT